jgi:hypothetical protein
MQVELKQQMFHYNLCFKLFERSSYDLFQLEWIKKKQMQDGSKETIIIHVYPKDFLTNQYE